MLTINVMLTEQHLLFDCGIAFSLLISLVIAIDQRYLRIFD